MDNKFASMKEDEDYALMEDFNAYLNLQDLGRCMEKHTTDASGYTTDGRSVNIELKRRNQTLTSDGRISGLTTESKPYTADTMYIEAHKVGDMLLDYVCEDKIPMYINFLNDGYVVIFNLSRLSRRPTKVGRRIYSKLYQGFELAKREELSMDDAWIYKKENNGYKMIRRGDAQ